MGAWVLHVATDRCAAYNSKAEEGAIHALYVPEVAAVTVAYRRDQAAVVLHLPKWAEGHRVSAAPGQDSGRSWARAGGFYVDVVDISHTMPVILQEEVKPIIQLSDRD
jgi:hypothetical protein